MISEGNFGQKKFQIGQAECPLTSVISVFDTMESVKLGLSHQSKKEIITKGEISMSLTLIEQNVKDNTDEDNLWEDEDSEEEDSNIVIVCLKELELKDLVDTGSRIDAQDPAIKFTIGKHQFQTQRFPIIRIFSIIILYIYIN